MRIAVTGATGFIGRHVLAELAKRNCQTIAIIRGQNPADLPGNPEVVHWDISNMSEVTLALIGSPDALLHLAWGSSRSYQSEHHHTLDLPTHYHFLSNLVQNGLKTLICSGTCGEYGLQYGPMSEDITTKPNNSYSIAKDTLRQRLELLRLETQFNFCWARLFYMYGPGQPTGTLFASLQTAVIEGRTHFDMSGGEQLRDYLPVETVARYLVDLLLAKVDCGTINVCSGIPISVRRLAETFCSDKGWDIRLNLNLLPYPAHEPMAAWGDTKKLRRFIKMDCA